MNEISKAIEILKKNKIIEALEFYNNRISVSHVPAIRSIKGIKSFKYDNIFRSTSFEYYEKKIQLSYSRRGGEIYQNDGSVFNLRRYGLLELKWDNETVLEIETSYLPFTINTNPDSLRTVKLNSEWMKVINNFYKEFSKIINKFDIEEKEKIKNIKKKNIDLGEFDDS